MQNEILPLLDRLEPVEVPKRTKRIANPENREKKRLYDLDRGNKRRAIIKFAATIGLTL